MNERPVKMSIDDILEEIRIADAKEWHEQNPVSSAEPMNYLVQDDPRR